MLDVRLGRWFSPDPITHPWQSPYCSMDNNPIILTDPIGLFGSHKEAREYRREHNIKGRIMINKDGSYSINNMNLKTSTFRDSESDRFYNSTLITARRNDNKVFTPFDLGKEWLKGDGAKTRLFTSCDHTVGLYKEHPFYENALEDIKIKLNLLSQNDPLPDYGIRYELDGIEGLSKFLDDIQTIITGGMSGNLMYTYLGSHTLYIEVTSIDIERKVANVVFTIHNTTTLASATRIP